MSSTPFGEHLKREREMRGVSIEEVAAATRISTRFVEAIESERWESLPGGVFNRGFIRSIARYLGLDEDSMVAEYALETRGKVDVGVVPDAPMAMPRDWKPAIVASILLAAILAGLAFVYFHYGSRILAHLHRKGTMAEAQTEVPATGDTQRQDPLASTATPDTGNVPSPNSGGINGAATTAATDLLELKVQAINPVQMTLAADGTSLFKGSIAAAETRQFEARNVLEITVSDPTAVILELNGQPVSPIGQSGTLGTIRLMRNDLKVPAGAPH